MANNSEIQRVWGILCLAYPSYAREIDPAEIGQTLKLYQRLLADVPGDVLEAAALQHIASCKWFPTVAELRGLCTSAAQPQLVSALEAWDEVRTAVMRWSRYAADGNMPIPEFSNPLIGRIVRSMGLIALQESENAVADRARFIQEYDELVRRGREEVRLLPAYAEKRAQLQGKDAPQEPKAPYGLTAAGPRSLAKVMQGMGLPGVGNHAGD